ncbi:ATP-binding protein [Siccirubricoccus sp. G192]|uniref:ATP-binding protein n=1 Tax=Siccirubricoccus sp. G192 TaxID=2849651 RepID=UPI001C2C99A1|nr:ATP-binding protein [Siccirubricoccus sp. G192]MBV1800332.1 hypothetical protein [Siccirubricoccus sp. G192]
MSDLQDQAIRQHCKALRMPTIGGQFSRLAETAIREKQSYLGYLEALLAAEMEERESRAITRLLHDARLPRMKTLEAFEFDRSGVLAAQVRGLRHATRNSLQSPFPCGLSPAPCFADELGTSSNLVAFYLSVYPFCHERSAAARGSECGFYAKGVARHTFPSACAAHFCCFVAETCDTDCKCPGRGGGEWQKQGC